MDQKILLSLTMSNYVSEQLERQKRLNKWYELDGRHDKDHPMHSLYTGLAEKYTNKEDQKDV